MADVVISVNDTGKNVTVLIGNASIPMNETDPTVSEEIKAISTNDLNSWRGEPAARQQADSLLSQSISAVHQEVIAHEADVFVQLADKQGKNDSIDAGRLTGTVDLARLRVIINRLPPVIPIGGTISSITVMEAALIGPGTSVALADGTRWLYNGIGDRNNPSSYILQADVTPDWSIIQNKPATFTPSAHTHTINDIAGLGTALSNEESDRILSDQQIRFDLENEATQRQNSIDSLNSQIIEIKARYQLFQLLRPL